MAISALALASAATFAPIGTAEALSLEADQSVTPRGEQSLTMIAPANGYVYFKVRVLDEGTIRAEAWSDSDSIQYDYENVEDRDGEYTTSKVNVEWGPASKYTKKTLGKLKSGKRYYVQVRAFQHNEDFDENVYSSWSGKKSAVVR